MSRGRTSWSSGGYKGIRGFPNPRRDAHTSVSPSSSQRAVALCAQPLPSHCYLFQKFPKVLTNTDFIVLEVRIESKFWVQDIKTVVAWIA